MKLNNESRGQDFEFVPLFEWNYRSQLCLALGTALLAAFNLYNQLHWPHELTGPANAASLEFRMAQGKDVWLLGWG